MNVTTNIKYASVSITESGGQTTLWARPYPHYEFKRWSDGNTQNPRTLQTSDITLVAEYEHESSNDSIYQYRCYVKDQLELNNAPKSFMRVKTFDITEDLLTTSNSTVEVYEIDENINNGDILTLYDAKGKIIYNGVIYSIQGTKIGLHQMQNFFKGNFVYRSPRGNPILDGKWKSETFQYVAIPTLENFEGLTPTSSSLINDNQFNYTDTQPTPIVSKKYTTYVYAPQPTTVQATIKVAYKHYVYLNRSVIAQSSEPQESEQVTFNLNKGFNEVVVTVSGASYGETPPLGASAGMTPHFTPSLGVSSQIEYSTYTLEEQLEIILGEYMQGKIFGSTYTDNLVAQRLNFTLDIQGNTNINLPRDTDDYGNETYSVKDMESFLYSLYKDYDIKCEFEINYSGTNYLRLFKPSYGSLKVGNNNHAILNLSPIQTIEETNRLIIFYSSETEEHGRDYRTTYVATSTGIVEEPISDVGRFSVVNTKIVYSDDKLEGIVAKELPTQMYNHKITFNLRLNNSLYSQDEFILGMPLDIFKDGNEYYKSLLTGWKLKKSENQNVSEVSMTCGKVRTAITKKLTLKDLL